MKRILSILLALVMVIGMLPMTLLTASAAEATATISFADKAQRTSYSTSQQVWEQNGITVTNDKAASTSNVGDYANPARFYASSKLTISCSLGNIKKIVATCSKNASSLVSSIGGEASYSGNVVTIVPKTSADTFEVAKLAAQVQISELTVTYEAAGSTEPSVPESSVPETSEPTGGETSSLAGKYYIAAKRSSGNYWYMTNDLGTASTKRYQIVDSGLTELPETIINVAASQVFELIASGNGYMIKSGDNYLGWTSGNSGILVTEDDAIVASIEAGDAEGSYKIYFAASDKDRYLSLNSSSSSNYYAWYALGQVSDLFLVPVNEAATPCEHTNTTTINIKEVSCGVAGYTGDEACSDCGEIIKEGTEIEALEHNYVNNICSLCGVKFVALEKASAIAVGDKVIFVCETKSVELNGFNGTSYATGAEYAGTPAATYVWNVVAGLTEGTVAFEHDRGYLAWTSGNSAYIADAISANSSWVVSFDNDGNALVVNSADNTRLLKWNAGSPRFACYTSAQTSIQIYILSAGGDVEPEDPETPACEHINQTTTTVPEKCEIDGSITITCDDCGEVLNVEVIPALDHNYIDGVCDECGAADPNAGTDENGEIVFELGENGSAAHADGSSATTYTETVGSYTLDITATDKMYTGGHDEKGNSCIKLGTSSVVGGFSFKVPDDVTAVIIRVAKYKANNSKVNVNGTEYTLTKNSNDGAYDEITVDTSTSKTVTLTTVSGACRAMINNITFVCSSDSEADHTCVWDEGTVTKTADCLEEGVMTYSCTVDGCDKIKTEAIAKTGHAMTNGTCSVCGAEYYTLSTTLNNNDSVVIYYPASKVAMTATASGVKLSGASVVIDESGLLTNDDLAIMKVQYVEGSTTDFYLICNGKYLTSGATGNSLTFAEEVSDYAEWYIEVVEGGENTVYIHNRNAVYNGSSQSMEFYSGFTTYGTKTTDIYKFQLYTKGENAIACEHSWSDWEIVNDASCTTAGEQKSVCANCGAEKTETIAATGHTYVFGDTEVTCTAGDVNVAKSDIGNVPKSADSNVYYVEGIVTFVDGGTVYIQDATGGVALRLASSVSAPAVGTQVEAVGSCSAYYGLIQLQNAEYEVVSTDNTVEAKAVTLAELMAAAESNGYLSEKVSLQNLTITEVGTYSASYKNVDYTVTDGTNTIKLYRAPAATADAVLAKGDVINVIAVVGTYNGYQLRVAVESDITKAAPTIELTHISLDPVNDALGFKAAIKGNLPADAQVGIKLSVEGGLEKTYLVNVADLKNDGVVSLRLRGIMAANGGEMKITGTPVIVIGEETITGASADTSMQETIEYINNNWADFADKQAVVTEYVAANYEAMKSWNIANIYTLATEE